MTKTLKTLAGYLGISATIFIVIQSCTKTNEYEPLEYEFSKPIQRSEAYYEALREFKKSDHAISFGWWGQSGVKDIGVNLATRYEGLPDSMDIVSLWGGYQRKGSPVWDEMQSVRKRKGTKFVWCMFGSGVSKLMKKNTPNLVQEDRSKWIKDSVFKAIDLVAKAMADSIELHQIDGFDLDYEPSESAEVLEVFGRSDPFGSVNNGKASVQRLFQALSKYLGPKSNTDKLLIIDGYYERGIEPFIDFYVQQAYNSTSYSALENRLRNFGLGEVPPGKFVVTENMQQYGPSGTSFIVNGVNIGSVLGMAQWNPINGRKGGFGAYIIEADALSNPSQGLYYNIRRGIQTQNPAIR